MKNLIWVTLSTFVIASACTSEPADKVPPTQWIYDKPNELFLGYSFGMAKQDFFTHSWELNKQQQIQNGAGAEILREETALKAPAKAGFYPTFSEEGQIISMPMTYSYDGWAPWNQHLSSDSLAFDLQEMLSDSLNITFQPIELAEDQQAYLFDDKLPMIRIQPIDPYRVRVIYALDYETLENSVPNS
ncbi:MAG: hypothetical protein RI519_07540 [Balneolaceae bacterium]|nr:hypothetical protein [Balneolaceae bacterium]